MHVIEGYEDLAIANKKMHTAQTDTQTTGMPGWLSTLLPPSEVLLTMVGVGMWREIKQRFQIMTEYCMEDAMLGFPRSVPGLNLSWL